MLNSYFITQMPKTYFKKQKNAKGMLKMTMGKSMVKMMSKMGKHK